MNCGISGGGVTPDVTLQKGLRQQQWGVPVVAEYANLVAEMTLNGAVISLPLAMAQQAMRDYAHFPVPLAIITKAPIPGAEDVAKKCSIMDVNEAGKTHALERYISNATTNLTWPVDIGPSLPVQTSSVKYKMIVIQEVIAGEVWNALKTHPIDQKRKDQRGNGIIIPGAARRWGIKAGVEDAYIDTWHPTAAANGEICIQMRVKGRGERLDVGLKKK